MKTISTFPQFLVDIDSEPLPAQALRTLEEIVVRGELSQPAMCELYFVSLPADSLPWPGARISVRLKAEEETTLFAGEVSAVEYIRRSEGERAVRVRAYDSLHSLRKKRSLRAHQQISAAGLAREITASLGIQVSAAEEGPAWPTLIQHNQSDFDFLRGVAGRSGLFHVLRGDTLHLFALNGLPDEVQLQLGDTLLEGSIQVNTAFSSGSVTVAAWDLLHAEPHQGEASTARTVFEAVQATNDGQIPLANRTAANDAQAAAIAQAELDLRRARTAVLSGVAEGDTALGPGVRVTVRGFPDKLPNRFVLTSVVHRVSKLTGFISEISTRPQEPEYAPEGAILAYGIVSDVRDPENLGRVRLTLPAVGGVETDWLEVVSPGAGRGKGWLYLPSAGDKVAALFAGGDFSAGIVLGGLFGMDGLADYGIEDKVVRFALVTPGGHKLCFDDSRKSLRLESLTGSYVEFTPEKVSLHSACDLEIAAPGKTVTIGAQAIDFRRL